MLISTMAYNTKPLARFGRSGISFRLVKQCWSRRSYTSVSNTAHTTLILQGRYMGYMRQLKPKQKMQVRRIKETKGVRAAIEKARMLAAA